MTVAGAADCKAADGLITFDACTADAANNWIELRPAKPIPLQGSATASFQVTVNDALNLPVTNATVDPVILSTSSNEFVSTSYQPSAGELSVATLTPEVDVVAADTNLNIALTTANLIPRDGKLMLRVGEQWNVGSFNVLPYFSSLSCNSFKVGGEVRPEGSYVCTFLQDRVQIDGGFTGDVPPGTQISIQLVGFRNPILANKPFNVFIVYTTGPSITAVVDERRVAISVSKPSILESSLLQVGVTQKDNIGIVQE